MKKKPDDSLVKQQLELREILANAEKARDEAIIAVRKARKTFDEFVKIHNDPVAQLAGWQRHQDWFNRPVSKPSPEDRAWLEGIRKKNEADIHSKIGIWWADVENGIPIPFLDHFKWIDGEKIGPLNKNEVWKNATIATVLVKLGVFKSVGEAKRANRDGPLKPGENRVKLGNSMKRIFME